MTENHSSLWSANEELKKNSQLEKFCKRLEKKGLFKNYNSQLRPDYYKKLKKSGIILEVERGKTLKNNMDLLDPDTYIDLQYIIKNYM